MTTIVVNGLEVEVDWVQVEISVNYFTRQFTFKDVSDSQAYSIGDLVNVYDDNGDLLISADIEYIGVGNESDAMYVYAGRNKAKYISDSDSESTIQFSENQKVEDVLSEIAGAFGIAVNGTASMPSEEIKTILIGDNLGEAFLEIAKSAGKVITSDADGDLFIEDELKNSGDMAIQYGVNVRNRKYVNDTSQTYDKYVVVAQSNYMVTGRQDVDVSGEFGSGNVVKVVRAKNALNADECAALAKDLFMRGYRKSVAYIAVVDSDMKLAVNRVYQVKDAALNIDEPMNMKALVYTMSDSIDEVEATLERIYE